MSVKELVNPTSLAWAECRSECRSFERERSLSDIEVDPSSFYPFALHSRFRPQDVILFMVGGATYEGERVDLFKLWIELPFFVAIRQLPPSHLTDAILSSLPTSQKRGR